MSDQRVKRGMGYTRCHLLLIACIVFGVPPDIFSLPASAITPAVQARVLGLLSPQFPLVFCSAKVCTSVASSLRLHFVAFFSVFFGIAFVDAGCEDESG